MTNIFSGITADEVWRKAFDAFRSNQNASTQQSRLGQTREILHAFSRIENPRERWILSRVPAINPAFALAEVIWILAGSNDAKVMNFWNPILPKYAGNSRTYHGAYGHRIRKNFGFDQLERAYLTLSKNPNSRQVVIQIWDPKKDFPQKSGAPASNDIPCNICSIIKIRNGRLEWFQIMRSNDFFRGMPYNFIQFTMLQEILAGWLNIEIGTYCQISDSLHIYEKDLKTFSIKNLPPYHPNTDKLITTPKNFKKTLHALYEALVCLSSKNLSKKQFLQVCTQHNIPQEYKNILFIIAADSARRRGWKTEMMNTAKECSNRALAGAWKAWLQRQDNKKQQKASSSALHTKKTKQL